MEQGTIFNIQHFSVHDGPGIRTVVFLKGCPLRCQWCANPESQKAVKELAWNQKECIKCDTCVNCKSNCKFRFDENGLNWEDANQNEIEELRKLCPSTALHVIGETKTIEEILKEVEKDSVFYDNSLGGLTISGGEPLVQSKFTIELLKEARSRGIHCAMESCGYANFETYKEVVGLLDYFITDIKSMDDDIHVKYTGVSNKLILSNLKKVRELYPSLPILIRTPVIPGVNDSDAAIKAIYEFISGFDNVRYELLKYHKFGEPKYKSLRMEYPLGDRSLDDELFNSLKKYEFSKIDPILEQGTDV